LPDVCPRLAANFAVLQRRFASNLGKDLMLLSVTVDPAYDAPPVLAAYARRWRADPNGWLFLTGDVAPLAAQLGEVYWTDEGSIGHNSMTSIIGRDGRLRAVVDGAAYRVDQLEHLIMRSLQAERGAFFRAAIEESNSFDPAAARGVPFCADSSKEAK
jgi:protein SCO1/2